MRVSTGFVSIAVLGLLLGSCQRETGFCETSGDCPEGRVCSAAEHLCLAAGSGGLVTLTVNTAGEGAVSVDTMTSPCSGSCQLSLPSGSLVKLVARPSGNARFSAWTEGCGGDTAACLLELRTATTVSARFVPKLCGGLTPADNWCWEAPLPQGNSLDSVWSFTNTDAWAVGGAGTILHWDGISWTRSPSGTTQNLHGVWGASPGDVWAVGDAGTVLRFTGGAWSPVVSGATARLNALWGSSATDFWAVGATTGSVQQLLHYTGGTFTLVATSLLYEMYGIWGSSANDIWTVGDRGVSGHFLGTSWAAVAVNGTQQPVYAVSGSSATDVWAVGAGGNVYRSGGATWAASPVPQALTAMNLRSVSVTGPGELWASGDGGALLRLTPLLGWSLARNLPDNTLSSVHAPAANGALAWAVGQAGTMLRKDPGTAWATLSSAPGATPYNFFQGLWGSANDDVWVSGYYGSLFHFDGAQLLQVRSNVGDNLFELWGSGPSDVWAVGNNGAIVHYDGKTWTPRPSGTSQTLFGIWGSDANNIWAVGTGATVVRYNGTSWNPQPIPGGDAIYGIWGRSATDIWAVGRGGRVYRFDGMTWKILTTPGNVDLYGVFGRTESGVADDVFAVGRAGTILHYEGGVFVARPNVAPTYDLYRIWGSGKANLFITGYTQPTGGIILKGNGATFSTSVVTTSGLAAIRGIGPSDVWAAGLYGAVLHNPTAPQTLP